MPELVALNYCLYYRRNRKYGKKIFNKDEMENYGIEITSVSSFIDEVNEIKDKLDESNEELFFRGQKTDF